MSLKLSRISAPREFSRYWNDAMTKIETAVDDIAATIASIQAILAGTTPFTALKINATSYTDSDLPKVGSANTWVLQQTFTLAPDAPGYKVSGTQIVGAQQAGWTAGTGTPNTAAFATYAGHTSSAGYVQAEAQATDDATKANSQRILAIERAMRTHGLIN